MNTAVKWYDVNDEGGPLLAQNNREFERVTQDDDDEKIESGEHKIMMESL